MKLYLDSRWLKKKALIDSDAKADLIYSRLFKNIIIKKLESISTIKTLFKEFQKLLKCYNILFNAIDNLRTIKHQISNFIMIDIGDLNIILRIL